MHLNQNHNLHSGRIGSMAFRQSQQDIKFFKGLGEGTNKYDLLLLIKRVGKTIGLNSRSIELLEYYMHFTKDLDWEEGASPIVFQSLSKTSLDLGLSERQIQRLEKKLFECGVITWRDSGNHKRYGRRCPKSGHIEYAYGVDLTPLAFLKEELEVKLEEKQLYDKAWLQTKRDISYYRRQIKIYLNEAGGVGGFLERYNEISKPIRTNITLKALRELLELHKELFKDIDAQLSDKLSCSDDKNVAHNKDTINKKSDKSDTRSFSNECFQEDCKADTEPKDEDQQERGSSTDLILATGLQHLTLKHVLSAASERFKAYIHVSHHQICWADIVEASYKMKYQLGISQKSWGRACQALGRNGAAICVLLTDRGSLRDQNRVMNPPAYFNGMLSKVAKKDLCLNKSIFSYIKKSHEA